MEYTMLSLPAFCVIGKEGSTDDGEGFIARLWDDANSGFSEVAPLALPDENGLPRIWGLMSDMSMSFAPWEDSFSRGRYLAGIEAEPDAAAPCGWSKWESPAYEYLVFPADGPDAFPQAIACLAELGLSLVGAAYDRTVPGEGSYIYLPIRKL